VRLVCQTSDVFGVYGFAVLEMPPAEARLLLRLRAELLRVEREVTERLFHFDVHLDHRRDDLTFGGYLVGISDDFEKALRAEGGRGHSRWHVAPGAVPYDIVGSDDTSVRLCSEGLWWRATKRYADRGERDEVALASMDWQDLEDLAAGRDPFGPPDPTKGG
jgi:hypothetical protein